MTQDEWFERCSDIISLARQKGYNVPMDIIDKVNISKFPEYPLLVACTFIQKWLIAQNIIICVNPGVYTGDYKPSYWYPTDLGTTIGRNSIKCNTYEEALALGIEYGLNKIGNEQRKRNP